MKTKLFLLGIITLSVLVSCEPKNELDELHKTLDQKKIEMSNLKLEIRKLQDKINEMDTAKTEVGIAVNVQKLNPEKFEHFFTVNGSFEAVEYAYISPETSGQVTRILVKEGDHVKRGQELARLNTAVIENNIREVNTALDLATTVYNKQKQLWENKIGSEMDYLRAKNDMQRMKDQLKTLESQLDMAIISSPIDGIVDQIVPNIGELAMPGQLLMQVVNLNEFYLNVEVSESYLPFLKKGDPVNISLVSYGDVSLKSNIYRIENIINPENRSFKVKIKVKNTNNMIRPNMLAEVQFKDFESDAAFVVPSIVVKKDFKGDYVFIAEKSEGNYISKKIYVETGRSIDNQTMVLKGLHAGDQVIVNGYNQVVEGSLLTIK